MLHLCRRRQENALLVRIIMTVMERNETGEAEVTARVSESTPTKLRVY